MAKLTKTYTQRGFGLYEFQDDYGNSCSLQRSSSITPRIWLGCNDTGLRVGMPWRNISDEEIKKAFGASEAISNTRMHLNREQVKVLIPILQKFVDEEDI